MSAGQDGGAARAFAEAMVLGTTEQAAAAFSAMRDRIMLDMVLAQVKFVAKVAEDFYRMRAIQQMQQAEYDAQVAIMAARTAAAPAREDGRAGE
jgi:hypothetical protein